MFKETTWHHGIFILLLANIVFLALNMQGMGLWPLQYARSVGKANSNASWPIEQGLPPISPSAPKQVTVRACILFYNGIPNYEAFKAWVEYHNIRWGLTHVDVFITERLSDTNAILSYASQDRVKIEVFYSHTHEKPVQSLGFRQTEMMNHVLQNAKLNNNTFVLYTDPDEILVSQDFRDFEDMFGLGHDAVSFPLFRNNYTFCTANAMHFGSLGYHSLRPFGSDKIANASLENYTDPNLACYGQRKFAVRAERWDHIAFVHDPICCQRVERDSRILDLTGRLQDGQHARLLHIRRKSVGIQADLSIQACGKVRSCKYLNHDGDCTNELEDAEWEAKKSEMTELLMDHPLFPDAARISLDAVCYAERYPSLREEFCDNNDTTKCRYGSLYGHFQDSGLQNNLTWGCKVYEQ